MEDPTDLNAENKAAWEELYASTSDLIWGSEPVGFLADSQPDFDDLPAGAVLDAAAGEGRNLPLLVGRGRTVVAADASGAALAKILPPVAGSIEKLECDLAAIPQPDASFAFILASDIVETLPDPLPVLREMARLLVPRGKLLVNIPGTEDDVAGIDMQPTGDGWMYQGKYYFHFYLPTEVDALFKAANLRVVHQEFCTWTEEPHPHFRSAPHGHRSRVWIAERQIEDPVAS